MISEGDFLVKERGRPIRPQSALDKFFGRRTDEVGDRRLTAQTAGQAMSAPPVTIDADRSIREAAAHDDRPCHQPAARHAATGASSASSLARTSFAPICHRDDDTLHIIRESVLHNTMWIDPDDLRVEVKDGHVRLEGVVDRRSTATILVKLIGLVDGVDRVQSDLRWDFDDTPTSRPPSTRPGARRGIARGSRARPAHSRLSPPVARPHRSSVAAVPTARSERSQRHCCRGPR